MSKRGTFLTALGILIFALTLVPIATTSAAGLDGTVDPTFQSATGFNNTIYSVVIQSDGKVIVGGAFTTHDATFRSSIARLNSDGSLDTTFNTALNGTVYALALQSDGKIIVGGAFTVPNSATRYITRLNSDGSLDTTFNTGSSTDGIVQTVAVQSDGKILLGGAFTNYNATSRNRLARLNNDGSLDAAFDVGNGANNTIHTIAVQADGAVIIGGAFSSYNSISRTLLARLHDNGSLDTAFVPNININHKTVRAVAIQADGKILAGGDRYQDANTIYYLLKRFNSNGSLDTTFTFSNNTVYFELRAILIRSNGKILVGGSTAGWSYPYATFLRPLNSDGSWDSTFDSGSATDLPVYAIALQTDNKVIIGGAFTIYRNLARNRIARLDSNGSLDTTFTAGSGASAEVNKVATQTDGKILVGGSFTFSHYKGAYTSGFFRLNPDASLDTSFQLDTLLYAHEINAIAMQADGKILIGGSIGINGSNYYNFARLNPNGSLDSSFDKWYGANAQVDAIAVQADGKILVGGFFTDVNLAYRSKIVRLNPDGSSDTTFVGPGDIPIGSIVAIVVQPDGKILIGGYFGGTANRLARLNPDGSLDSTFIPPFSNTAAVWAITLQSDGKILVGGNTLSAAYPSLARLNNNGSFDTTFNPGVFTSASTSVHVRAISLQADSKILAGGNFDSIGKNIIRLNSNGSSDDNFNPGEGADDTVNTIVVQGNNKVLLGGKFRAVGSYTRNYLARIYSIIKTSSSISLTSALNPSTFGQNVTFTATTSPLTATGTVTFTFGTGVNSINITTTLVGGVATYVTSTLPAGSTPVKATYSGDDFLFGSNSPVYTQTVNKIATNISLTSNANPAVVDTNLIFTATVAPPTASGLVTFTFGLNSITRPLVNGVATVTSDTPPAGTYTVTATYAGDANHLGSTSEVYTQTIIKKATSISLNSSENPAVVGTNLTFTTTVVPPTASGLVTFTFTTSNGVASITSTSLLMNGLATYMTNTLPVGTYTVTATYSGNATHATSTSAVYTQVIVAACNPQLVTSPTDDGQATTCGTLSYALATTASGTISFALSSGNLLTFTGSLIPTLAAGVTLDGGATGIVLNGNGVTGDGLRLGGGNSLSNLTISGFGGREIVAAGGATANKFYKVKVSS